MSCTLRTALRAGSGVGALVALAVAAPLASANPFYEPPASLPAENGAIVKMQAMKLGVNVQTPSGYAMRIMYKSVDTNGTPVAVTGVYIEPKKAWTGTGPRPLITYAEGTQGQGDRCAPSYGLENAITFNSGTVNVAYETPNIAALVDRGFGVVVTDYMGLGTPDRIHTYVNRVDQGHAVLDAARAAIKVPGATVTAASPVGAYGYSQGGGAAASAAELHPTYAPDVNLKGAYAGAPPADLSSVMRKADGTTLTAVIGFAVNGFVSTYPELKPILDANTNTAGKAALAKIANSCIGDGALAFAYSKTGKWTTSGRSVSTVVAENPAAQAIVDAQKIGNIKPEVPVRIVTGTKDDIVPHGQAKQLAINWCNLGAKVNYAPVRQWVDSFGTSLNHLGPSLTEGAASQAWIAARVNGVAASSDCVRVPSMP